MPFAHTSRALAADSAHGALVALAVAGALLALWLGWFVLGRVEVTERSQRARLEVRQAAHRLDAPRPGVLRRAPPPLGSEVRRGEVLAELDDQALVLQRQEATVRRDGLLRQAAALRDEIAVREAALEAERQAVAATGEGAARRADEGAAGARFASAQAERLRLESEAGSVARVEAERASADAQRQDAALEALRADRRRLLADGQARVAQQRAQLGALRRQLAALDAEVQGTDALLARLALDAEHHLVRAPVDGRVAERAPVNAGETVAAGQKLATVLPSGELVATAEFEPAAALGRIHPGQAATLALDGFPWARHGHVAATVARVAGELRDGRVRVEFTLDPRAPALRDAPHGAPGVVEVRLDRVAPHVLVLRALGSWERGR